MEIDTTALQEEWIAPWRDAANEVVRSIPGASDATRTTTLYLQPPVAEKAKIVFQLGVGGEHGTRGATSIEDFKKELRQCLIDFMASH